MEKNEILKRNLNGLPGNLALSYLSTLGCEGHGYMTDWIHHVAKKNNITELVVDIIEKKVTPKEAEMPHLVHSLGKLQEMITSNLKKHEVENAFITKATMRFEITNEEVFCFPQMENKEGEVYKGKKKIVRKVTPDFNPKPKTLAEQIKEAK